MKRNIIVKFLIDISMAVLYVLLMFARGLGEFFHEAAGIGIGILFLLHILLNLQMLKSLFKSVLGSNSKTQRDVLAVSDAVLIVCMPIVILTGVLIARELFAIDSGISWSFVYNIHNILSYVCLGIIALHTLLHAKYLLGIVKKLPSAFSGKEMRAALLRYFAGAAAAITLYFSLAVHNNLSDKNIASGE